MTKRVLILALIVAMLLPGVLASLSVEKVDKGSVIISELNNPAVFNLTINNPDGPQQAEIYSFTGISFSPRGFFDIQTGPNNLEMRVYPSQSILSQRGLYNLQYQIKGTTSGITADSLQINIVGLKDALIMKSSDLNLGDDKLILQVTNTQNTNLENLNLDFSSLFFNESKTLSLTPYQSANVSIDINKDNIKSLSAGRYTFTVGVGLQSARVSVDGSLNYLPKEASTLYQSGRGFVLRQTNYTRTNTGNVPMTAQIQLTEDILSRLFTLNSADATQVNRHALYATYIWEKSLQPGESFSVISTTNYTLPLIFVLLIVVIALLVKLYTRTNLVADKRVSYVKTRGGEFALKVTIHVKAKKYVENIQLIDRLPGVAQLYEKFGIMPDKFDKATKRLFWNIERLNAGEERVYSYIIYSKVRIVGRFELPPATLIYLRDGKTEQTLSNKAFFVTETNRSDIY